MVVNHRAPIHAQHRDGSDRINAVLNAVEVVGLAFVGGHQHIARPGDAVGQKADGDTLHQPEPFLGGIPTQDLHQPQLGLVVRHSNGHVIALQGHRLRITAQRLTSEFSGLGESFVVGKDPKLFITPGGGTKTPLSRPIQDFGTA